jgi:CheY-like chemotaxis protein
MQAKLSLAHDLNIRWILSLRLSPFKGLQIRVIIERLRMLKSQERESDLHIQSDHPKTILIVDDEKSIRDVLIAFFVEQGYDVITASDGREGIAKFQSHPTDLVITDIVMPRVEGIETIRKIRKQSNTVKIIAMTGYVDSYLKDALLLGADDSINKPFNTEDLMAVVDRVTAG